EAPRRGPAPRARARDAPRVGDREGPRRRGWLRARGHVPGVLRLRAARELHELAAYVLVPALARVPRAEGRGGVALRLAARAERAVCHARPAPDHGRERAPARDL